MPRRKSSIRRRRKRLMKMAKSDPERNYYECLVQIGCVSMALVGAGVGGGFTNTQELHVMKYDEAMKTKDKKDWVKAVEEEPKRMLKFKVFKPVKRSELTDRAKVLSTMWAMKKNSNGTF
jgi:hypothetical protein